MTEMTAQQQAEAIKTLVWGQVANAGRAGGSLVKMDQEQLALVRKTVAAAGSLDKLESYISDLKPEQQKALAAAVKEIVVDLTKDKLVNYDRDVVQKNARVVAYFQDPTMIPQDASGGATKETPPGKTGATKTETPPAAPKPAVNPEDIRNTGGIVPDTKVDTSPASFKPDRRGAPRGSWRAAHSAESVSPQEMKATTELSVACFDAFRNFETRSQNKLVTGAAQQLHTEIERVLKRMTQEVNPNSQAIRANVAKLVEALQSTPPDLNAIASVQSLYDRDANIQLAAFKTILSVPKEKWDDLSREMHGTGNQGSGTNQKQDLLSPEMKNILDQIKVPSARFEREVLKLDSTTQGKIFSDVQRAANDMAGISPNDLLSRMKILDKLARDLSSAFPEKGPKTYSTFILQHARDAMYSLSRNANPADKAEADQIALNLDNEARVADGFAARQPRIRQDQGQGRRPSNNNQDPTQDPTQNPDRETADPEAPQGSPSRGRGTQMQEKTGGLTGGLASTDPLVILKEFNIMMLKDPRYEALAHPISPPKSTRPSDPGTPANIGAFLFRKIAKPKSNEQKKWEAQRDDAKNYTLAKAAALKETALECCEILVEKGVVTREKLNAMTPLQMANRLARYNAGDTGQTAAPAAGASPQGGNEDEGLGE